MFIRVNFSINFVIILFLVSFLKKLFSSLLARGREATRGREAGFILPGSRVIKIPPLTVLLFYQTLTVWNETLELKMNDMKLGGRLCLFAQDPCIRAGDHRRSPVSWFLRSPDSQSTTMSNCCDFVLVGVHALSYSVASAQEIVWPNILMHSIC